MNSLTAEIGAMRVHAEFTSAGVETLGISVRFEPGVPAMSQRMALETVMRGWANGLGQVTRGGEARVAGGNLWLPGWTCQSEEGTVLRMSIGFAARETKST